MIKRFDPFIEMLALNVETRNTNVEAKKTSNAIFLIILIVDIVIVENICEMFKTFSSCTVINASKDFLMNRF